MLSSTAADRCELKHAAAQLHNGRGWRKAIARPAQSSPFVTQSDPRGRASEIADWVRTAQQGATSPG